MANKSLERIAGVTTEDLLLALVTLEVDKREAQVTDKSVKTEVLLSNAGLDATKIASIMGKNPGAVRMAISRSKPKSKSKGA